MDEQNKVEEGQGISRRAVVAGLLPAVAAMASGRSILAAAAPAQSAPSTGRGTFPGLITRERGPVNLEMPFATLDGLVTPTNQFFVRSHFPIPQLSASGWRLEIDGHVQNALSIGYDELRKMPSKTVMATLECAGNSRALLAPKVKGLLWEQGAASNATWTGVPLAALLERAGIREGAPEVTLTGADKGTVNDEPKSPGVIRFARSLPIAKARSSEVIIAYRMNGEELTPEHGFPVRAIVPGWYGMASIKWLTGMTVTASRYEGYWQTLEYAYWKRAHSLPTLTPVTKMQVKSQIARPARREVIAAGKPYRVFGAAWTGESSVARVEFSPDGGKTWRDAKLLGQDVPFAWRLWEFNWQTPTRGRHTLMVRATDRAGNRQPMKHDPDRRNYMVSFIQPVEIEVR